MTAVSPNITVTDKVSLSQGPLTSGVHGECISLINLQIWTENLQGQPTQSIKEPRRVYVNREFVEADVYHAMEGVVHVPNLNVVHNTTQVECVKPQESIVEQQSLVQNEVEDQIIINLSDGEEEEQQPLIKG